jgi:tRNA-binding EMAP/Myf-like protein
MKVTLGWLKDHLETDASLDTIVERLTMIGLEVDGVEDRGKAFAPFTVGRVVSAVPHPDADRLRVCVVDTGSGEVQVVCGAPNARTGMKGVFAPVGSAIPGTGKVLERTTIRGIESNGMLCSARELLLGEDHAGIVELPPDAPVGRPANEAIKSEAVTTHGRRVDMHGTIRRASHKPWQDHAGPAARKGTRHCHPSAKKRTSARQRLPSPQAADGAQEDGDRPHDTHRGRRETARSMPETTPRHLRQQGRSNVPATRCMA